MGLANCTEILPHTVLVSSIAALAYPSAFVWFGPKYYAPSLGFLMLAVGLNLNAADFRQVLATPKNLLLGTTGQWVVKPLLAWLIARGLVPLLPLPPGIANGLLLVACVSGAQMSNYATFLIHPALAPLSIVLTALSTLEAVVATPLLSKLYLGRSLPVDPVAMSLQIVQIVLLPVALGLGLNRLLGPWLRYIQPAMSASCLVVTVLVLGASLGSQAAVAMSTVGLLTLLPVTLWHWAAFYVGYEGAKWVPGAARNRGLFRCLSLETGMQSSLLALLLATKFFQDPMVALVSSISIPVMTLSGFLLVLVWKKMDQRDSAQQAQLTGGGSRP